MALAHGDSSGVSGVVDGSQPRQLEGSGFERWLPASVLALRGTRWRTFIADLIAGVTVGLVALPLAMAFASPPG